MHCCLTVAAAGVGARFVDVIGGGLTVAVAGGAVFPM